MADRNFNRDRNRPYDNDYNDESYGQDYQSRGRSDREYGYGRNMGRNYGMRNRNMQGGFDRYSSRYDDYGGYNRGVSGYERYGGYNRGMSGYGTNRDYDYDFDNDQWSRADYGRGQGGYGYGGYGYGGSYGQNFGGGQGRYGSQYNRGYGGNYGRGYGSSGYGRGFDRGQGSFGYGNESDYDYDMDFEDYEEPTIWTYEEVWIIPGPFTGIGPEGYQRSDERIREDINERLTQHGRLNARNVQVEVNNCEVTLKGSVDSRQAKRMAEEVAESVSGVKDVNNQLRVQDQQQISIQSGTQQSQNQMQGQQQGQRSQQTQQSRTEREGQSQRQRGQ